MLCPAPLARSSRAGTLKWKATVVTFPTATTVIPASGSEPASWVGTLAPGVVPARISAMSPVPGGMSMRR